MPSADIVALLAGRILISKYHLPQSGVAADLRARKRHVALIFGN
jgi:hypothetical protein